MSFIDGELLVNFDERPGFIVNFLPEANGDLFRVDLLQVSSTPTVVAEHIQPVAATTIIEIAPLPKLALILFARGHREILR
jgi:hypothetical protein